MMHFFTSINLNYLPKARVLAHSVKLHHPGMPFTLMLCERRGSFELNLAEEPFDEILYIEDLGVPVTSLSPWIFGHTVVELCTAVKPFACKEIFKRGDADAVVYLDPDIQVFDSLQFIETCLRESGVLLTPHMLEPAPSIEEVELHEISCLRHGTFNLGFFAIERQLGRRFLDWWCERLLNYCHDDIMRGLFTDQRWVDLAPSLFEETFILRDFTCNVASWNVSRRAVSLGEDGHYLVNGSRLRFFHFSGFDSGTHDRIIAQVQPNNTALRRLTEEYRSALAQAGQHELSRFPWSYGCFDNGRPIEKAHRVAYRSEPKLQLRFRDPFVTGSDGGYAYWYKKHFTSVSKSLSKLSRLVVEPLKRIGSRYTMKFRGQNNR
jgi:hypothetical protein